MYTYEIQNYLVERNYELTVQEYMDMVGNSNQVNHVKFNPYDLSYEIWTADGYYAKFKVKEGNIIWK